MHLANRDKVLIEDAHALSSAHNRKSVGTQSANLRDALEQNTERVYLI